MPCNDVTELLEVVLDSEDRLSDYTFMKRSCGKAIGAESLLTDQLRGRSLDELLHKTAQEYLDEFPVAEEIEEFLGLKHLFAIQGALEVLTGLESGDKNAAFAASEVVYSEDATRIAGRIAIDILTDKIASCGGCSSCGSETTIAGQEENVRRRAERAETHV